MPSRILDGEIARSESLSRVSRDAALTFVLLLSVVDDHGRFDARPRAVLAAVYGMRDDVQVAALETWLDELEREQLILRYAVDTRPYLLLPTWFDYQRRREVASKWPDPPQESEKSQIPPQEVAVSTDLAAESGSDDDHRGSRTHVTRARSGFRVPGSEGREEKNPADAGELSFEPGRTESKSANGVVILERMREASEPISEFLGLPPLDCRWTKPRQKLISAAYKAYAEDGDELGAVVLEGFRRRAADWPASMRLGSWSVESMFAPANVGKNHQAAQNRSPPAAREPERAVAPFDLGPPIGVEP